MSKVNPVSRRRMMIAAGAASLGILGLRPAPAAASKWERLDKALVEMRECKKFLQNAPDIFGGHKKKSIEHLTASIDEIENAIKFASKK